MERFQVGDSILRISIYLSILSPRPNNSITVLFHVKLIGFPQMEVGIGKWEMGACPNGPCATLFGPCVADSDCIGDNMACVDDMDSCMNMIAPCCLMAPAGRSG